MMPAVEKAFDLMGDDRLGLPTKKESLKTEKGSHDKKWLEESKAKLLKCIEEVKRAKYIV